LQYVFAAPCNCQTTVQKTIIALGFGDAIFAVVSLAHHAPWEIWSTIPAYPKWAVFT
jgi:hypothetical protein